MRVVIILPTYNERENISIVLEKLFLVVKTIKNHSIDYLVVDDSSPDNTAETVSKYAKKYNSVHLISGKKEGLGRAIMRGLKYANEKMHADIMIQMDADLSHDPEKIPVMLDKIDHGADFVLGSRYIRGGSIPENWGIHRKIFSVVGNSIVRFGLGFSHVHDWTGGFRAYKKYYAQLILPEMYQYNGYVFQIAFLHKSIKAGAHIEEVPFHFIDRKYGHSKIAPSEYIKNVIEYVIRSRWNELIHGP
jgi:dolichol-phosphate mannosyltransferase